MYQIEISPENTHNAPYAIRVAYVIDEIQSFLFSNSNLGNVFLQICVIANDVQVTTDNEKLARFLEAKFHGILFE